KLRTETTFPASSKGQAYFSIGPITKKASSYHRHIFTKAAASLAPCSHGDRNDLAANCESLPAVSITVWKSGSYPPSNHAAAIRQSKPESFHWGPALWQSLEFLVLEHAFRIANDHEARYLLLHRPFWHDYFASASHFDMSRWGDGDDFIVN